MNSPAPTNPDPDSQGRARHSVRAGTWMLNERRARSGGVVATPYLTRFEGANRICGIELLWAAVAGALIPVGLLWDFSWENTIGIDRFWSPPHLTVNVGVWLMGILGAWVVFKFSFAQRRNGKQIGIKIGPLNAPSGGWIILWGAALFQLALPLDDWWQQAYGLGAGLWHPPQILKAVSFVTILFGGMVLNTVPTFALAHETFKRASSPGLRPPSPPLRAEERDGERRLVIANGNSVFSTERKRGSRSFRFYLWHSGLLLTMCAIFLTADSYANWQHGAWFYKISAAIYPAVLLGCCVARHRWAATQAALIYTILLGAMVWILPLFPAKPLTAPIHNPTDHMLPPAFPLLLIFPAVVLDLLRLKFAGVKLAVIGALAFMAAFISVQWFFAEFLLSPRADNWFFAGGGKHWPFFLKIDQARVQFWNAKQDLLTPSAIFQTIMFATASSWLGLQISSWLNKLRR